MDFKTGGREVIERLIEAYGFHTRQALCDHLGVSKSTLATRFMRDIFPAEWVVQCALETGVSLGWIVNGQGVMFDNDQLDVTKVPRKKIIDGKIFDSNYYIFDKSFLPSSINEPVSIIENDIIYIADYQFDEISDGKWLIDIEGKYSIRDLTRIPVGKVRVSNQTATFECAVGDIKPLAKCIFKLFTAL